MTLVSLVLRVSPDDLAKDPYSDGFGWSDSLYGDLLLILLILTIIPVVIVVVRRSSEEKALELLQKIAYSEEVKLHRALWSACLRCS